MYVILSAVALLGLAQGAAITSEEQTWPPSFCNGRECPKFDVVQTTMDYEERKYDLSNWVTTEFTGLDHNSAKRKMFWRLFQYIQGNNENEQKIPMTVPVITRIIPTGSGMEDNFTMSFYLHIDDPPQPNDKDVYLSQLPQDFNVYVKIYGGFSSEETYLEQSANLAQELPSSSSYRSDFYYVAGYDSPWKRKDRHNEIWFVKN